MTEDRTCEIEVTLAVPILGYASNENNKAVKNTQQ
jgi:hypothetical protein